MLGHMVYFTLKDNSPAKIDANIASAKKHLDGHPGIVHFSVGKVAPDLAREVNQRDFDVALHIVFESRQAHDDYQAHPRHGEYIKECKENWARVRVFDANVV